MIVTIIHTFYSLFFSPQLHFKKIIQQHTDGMYITELFYKLLFHLVLKSTQLPPPPSQIIGGFYHKNGKKMQKLLQLTLTVHFMLCYIFSDKGKAELFSLIMYNMVFHILDGDLLNSALLV